MLFAEQPTLAGASGIALVIAGILAIAGGPAALRAGGERALKGLGYGLLTGVFIASYTINDAYAVKFLAVSPFMIDYFGNAVRLAFLTPTALSGRGRLRAEWKRNRGIVVGVGALMPLSYILCLYAFTIAPVSYVAPARELSLLVGTFFGARLLNEGNFVARMLGAGLIVVGVFALVLA